MTPVGLTLLSVYSSKRFIDDQVHGLTGTNIGQHLYSLLQFER
jgi:hypothetical protein